MEIAHDTILQFRKRIDGFRPKYIQDWIAWMGTPTADRARELKRILGKWQACRGNTLRLAAAEGHALHSPPYLCDLLARAQYHVNTLQSFDLRSNGSYTKQACDALRALWEIFEDLSYARSNLRCGLGRRLGYRKQDLPPLLDPVRALLKATNSGSVSKPRPRP